MEKKDLSLVYALKEYARVNGESDLIFEDNKCFTFDDIKDAFNAGRESVVEDASELEWKGYAPFIHASTPIGRYNMTISEHGYYALTERKFHSLLVAL